MYPQKYFTLNLIINEIFSVEKFVNYGNHKIPSCAACCLEDIRSVKFYLLKEKPLKCQNMYN